MFNPNTYIGYANIIFTTVAVFIVLLCGALFSKEIDVPVNVSLLASAAALYLLSLILVAMLRKRAETQARKRRPVSAALSDASKAMFYKD